MSWWRHQMEAFSAVLALSVGDSTITGEFPWQPSVMRSFEVFFDRRLNKRLSKQARRRWFETPSPHYNVTVMCTICVNDDESKIAVAYLWFMDSCHKVALWDIVPALCDEVPQYYRQGWPACLRHMWDRLCATQSVVSWWRHQMEAFSALLAICAGNSPGTGEFPTQRPVTRSFDVFVDLRLNKRLSKPWWGWWFETLSRPLWRHRNVIRYLLRSDAVCNVIHGLAWNFALGASLWLHRRKSWNIIGAYFAK